MRAIIVKTVIVLSAILLFSPSASIAQTLSGPGQSCAALIGGFAGSEHPQAIYLNNTIPAAERGCWVHLHPNGTDRVLTPLNWTADPSGSQLEIVEGSLEAITRSRSNMLVVGGTMNLSYNIMLTSNGVDLATSWPNGNECWIRASETSGWEWNNAGEFQDAKQLVAHEIGHCFLMENIDGYTPATYSARNAHWWDESGAEIMGTFAYSMNNDEHRYARRYDLDGAQFSVAYNAFVIFDHLVQALGPNSLLPFFQELHATTSNNANQWRLMGSDPSHRIYHETVTMHYESRLPDPGCSPSSDCFYPAEATVSTDQQVTLSDDISSPVALTAIEGGRLNLVQLTLPEGRNFFISPPNSPSVELLSSVVDDGVNGLFVTDLIMETSCDVETVMMMAITHFNPADAGSNTSLSNAELSFTTTAREDCDATSDLATQSDAFGYAGRWYATNVNMLGMYKRLYGNDGPEVQAVRGDIILDLGEDGQSRVTWDDVILYFETDSGIPPITLRGHGNFKWRAGGGTLLHLDGQSYDIEAEVLGIKLPGNGLFEVTDADTTVTIGKTVTGALIFAPTSSKVFLPTFWVRRE